MASDSLPLQLVEAPAELVAFRYSSYDVPFWVRENSRPGRWNLAGDQATQYWSLSPQGAWAELIRHENLRNENDLDLVRMYFWACRVRNVLLLDLRVEDERRSMGITQEELTGDDWTSCQRLAGTIRDKYDGVIAAACALPTEANITLFGPRRPIGWARRPALASALPTAQVAIGRPPAGLVPRVVYRRPGQQETLF